MKHYCRKMPSAYLPSPLSVIFQKEMLIFQFDDYPEASLFLKEIDRGGLLSQNKTIFNCLLYSAGVSYEILSNDELRKQFLKLKHRRNVFCSLMEVVVGDHQDPFFGRTFWTEGHNLTFEISHRFLSIVCVITLCMNSLMYDKLSAGNRKS